MVFKIPNFKNRSGFTLVELIISVGIIMVLATSALLYSNIAQDKSKSRDLVRFSDLAYLESAISQYIMVEKTCPDNSSQLRVSDTVPSGSAFGWLVEDLTDYIPKLPVDPLNNATYIYSYFCSGIDYEINANLEHYTDKESSDGGNNLDVFETGTNLTLIN